MLSRYLLSSARPRVKSSLILAFAICPLMLAVSMYGFWKLLNISVGSKSIGIDQLYYIMCVAIIPLAGFIFLAITAAQRIENSRLSASYQSRMDQLQKRLNAQEDLLHLVTSNDPEIIAVFDQNNCYWYANESVAQFLEVDIKSILGKPISKFIENDRAKIIEARLDEVRRTGQPLQTLDQRPGPNGEVRFIQARYEKIPPLGEFPGGIMVRAENVTGLIIERERRETMLRQVIATLVAVVDRRDPYAAGHSERVGQLSRVIAEEMVLSEKEIETAEISGSLMNFGKVLVPREILTKTTALTSEELQRVRDSILTSADILSIINFAGPVVPTLRQVLERYDGTGVPQGLKGDAILISARIVAVANTFVALVSTRAHRASFDPTEAVQRVMADADKAYDRKVVAALANYIQNRTVKFDWLSQKGNSQPKTSV